MVTLILAAILQEGADGPRPELRRDGPPRDVEVRLLWWRPDASGSVRMTEKDSRPLSWLFGGPASVTTVPGTNVAFDDELGAGREEVPSLECEALFGEWAPVPSWHVRTCGRFAFWTYESGDNTVLSSTEVIDGRTFAAGTPVGGNLDVDCIAIDFEARGRAAEADWLELCATVAVRYSRIAFDFGNGATHVSERIHSMAIGPGLGLDASLGAWASIGARAIACLGLPTTQIEAEARLAVRAGPATLEAGWRQAVLDWEGGHGADDDEVDLKLAGPYFSVVVGF